MSCLQHPTFGPAGATRYWPPEASLLAVRDEAVADQVEYYRQRAPVYDQRWARRGSYVLPAELHRQWVDDVAEVEQVVHDFASHRRAAWPRHDPPPPGARRESRSLPDGGTYTVLKRYWRPDELERDLDARGWDATAGTTAHGMILHARAGPAATPPRSGLVTAGTPAPRTGG
jgi:hypothetical protein